MALNPTIILRFQLPYFLGKFVNRIPTGRSKITPGEIKLSDTVTITHANNKDAFEDGLSLSESLEINKDLYYNVVKQQNDGVLLKENVSVLRNDWLFGVIPVFDIFVFNPDEVSPEGNRHIPSGSFAYESNARDYGSIEFGEQYISPGTSKTKVLVLSPKKEIGVVSYGNIRLWQSGFGPAEKGAVTFNYEATSTWTQARAMASGDGNILPQSLPGAPNVRRQDGSLYINGNNGLDAFSNDENVSEYIYMSINTRSSISAGFYGPDQGSDVKLRLTYDYFNGPWHSGVSG